MRKAIQACACTWVNGGYETDASRHPCCQSCTCCWPVNGETLIPTISVAVKSIVAGAKGTVGNVMMFQPLNVAILFSCQLWRALHPLSLDLDGIGDRRIVRRDEGSPGALLSLHWICAARIDGVIQSISGRVAECALRRCVAHDVARGSGKDLRTAFADEVG